MNELMNTNNANTTTIALLEKNTAFVNGTLFTSRDYTVRELVALIENGTICYNQTTQRNFIYNNHPEFGQSGKLTKSGALIRDMLEDGECGVDIPAVFLVYNTDTCTINIHDGKQRLLSLYYFTHPGYGEDVSVEFHGTKLEWATMDDALKEKLMNYLITVSVRRMDTKREEHNFYAINSNAVELTEYEKLRGCMFGKFLTTFEDHMAKFSSEYKNIEDTRDKKNRGKRSFRYLVHFFNLENEGGDEKTLHKQLRKCISRVRNNEFVEDLYDCDHILRITSMLMTYGFGNKEEDALRLAKYIVERSNLDAAQEAEILGVYRDDLSKPGNDMSGWKIGVHESFIKTYFNEDLPAESRHLDPMRYAPKSFFEIIARKNSDRPIYRCQNILPDGTQCTCEGSTKMQMDHIVPWSKGGRTTIDNLQFLCESCNKSLGNKDKK